MTPSSFDPKRFGHRPEEQVFGGQVRRPPSTRIRVAAAPMEGSLRFEPEVGSQADEIRAVLTPGPTPMPSLAFEPDEGEPLDRVVRRETAPLPGASPQEAIDALVKLAGVPEAPPPPRPPAQQPPRLDVAGDLEAEMFGPGRKATPRAAPTAVTETMPRPTPTQALTKQLPETDPGEETAGQSRSWISVFLSDQVAGKKKKRKRRSTIFRRNTAIVGNAAGKAAGAIVSTVRSVARGIDAITSRYRLPLNNIIWSALIALLTVWLGVGMLLGGVFLVICLTLTVAGQSARNLIGFSGIIICSAAVAEIVRQRERFLEVLLDLF